MDNVTHTLFALTIARTPLGRVRGATAALVLASNAPDIDIVAALGGSANYLAWHRGPTHGPLGVVGLAAVTAGLVRGAQWYARRRSSLSMASGTSLPDAAPASFAKLFAVAAVGILAHVLMDLPTSYGTRVLSPFTWRWFAMDLMPIVDIYLLAILGAGLAIGRGSPQRARNAAAIVLVLMATNYGVRAAAHQRALAMAERTLGPRLPPPCDPRQAFRSLVDSWPRPTPAAGQNQVPADCLVEAAAILAFLSPFGWRIIARLPRAYEMSNLALGGSAGSPTRVSNHWTPLVAEAARTPTAGAARLLPLPAAQLYQDGRVVRRPVHRPAIRPRRRQHRPASRRSALFTVTVTLMRAERSCRSGSATDATAGCAHVRSGWPAARRRARRAPPLRGVSDLQQERQPVAGARGDGGGARVPHEGQGLEPLPVVSHASYLINLATTAPALWRQSIAAMADELGAPTRSVARRGPASGVLHRRQRARGSTASPMDYASCGPRSASPR